MFSATTTPLRVIRARVPRLISPLRTIYPAMSPNYLLTQISRTCALPWAVAFSAFQISSARA